MPRTARCVFRVSTALAAVAMTAALTQPPGNVTGAALAVAPAPTAAPTTAPATPPTSIAAPTTTVAPAPAPPTTAAPRPPVTATPTTRVTAAPAPTSPPAPPVYVASGKRESCGWSWDATHFDDGSLNEVTILLDAPRRPNTPVTMTGKPGASALESFATTTDAQGQASMIVSLSNDKRDWTLAIGARFPGSSCDARSFTIAY